MTADEDTVEELLTLYTIRSKMQKAIEAEADANVTDEEANERGYTMMTISTTSHQDDSGNTVEYTDDEKKQLKETANKIEDAVKNGKLSKMLQRMRISGPLPVRMHPMIPHWIHL